MKYSLKRFSRVVLSLLLMSGVAWAQGTAQLNGKVTDESGAVLPGVTVTATQTDTGAVRTAVTDAGGTWLMQSVPLGPYKIEIALEGFRTYVQTGIVLQVNANPVINAALALGNLAETVTVDAGAPLVDVRTAGLRDVVEQERIVELPLNGRQVTDLIVLAGGAVNTGRVSVFSSSNAVGISVAGGLRNGVQYILDGAVHNSTHDNTNLPFPFPDAMQEFSVATGGLAAANGTHSGASVNAVTKSGTNSFHGNGFEFVRDSRFNAKGAFAPLGPDGVKLGDGLNRNVFGGTLGGAVVKDKLFFFFGVEGQRARQITPDNLAFVPTAAMLAGDFTAAASPACRAAGQLTLKAPFVNNQMNPALFSPAAVKIANSGWLPTTTDPCGAVRFSAPMNSNQTQYVARVDYQLSANHSIFGRYINTNEEYLPALAQTHDVLVLQAAFNPERRRPSQTLAIGDTRVFGANTVNAIRGTYVRTGTRSNQPAEQYFDAQSLGIPGVYTGYVPGTMAVAVTSAFTFSGSNNVGAIVDGRTYQGSDDLSRVWGRHQLAVGASTSYSTYNGTDFAGSNATFTFSGAATGLALADFLTGRMSAFGAGAPVVTVSNTWYIGAYGSDTWRASDRVTLNLGLRWEPYLGNNYVNNTISNFSIDNFRNGVKSTQYVNAPAGLIFPGDPGFPPGDTGFYKRWWNFSPRLGLAWDVNGDGRLAVRSSYAINYDFPGSAAAQSAANVPPFGGGVSLTGNIPFDNPYGGVPGGSRLPIVLPAPRNVVFPSSASYSSIDPNINSIRVQAWNATIERQIGASWQVSASYLGSYIDRIWGPDPINTGVYLGLGPCTLQGVSYPVCSTVTNLASRQALTLLNPQEGQYLASVFNYTAIGTQRYRGLKLSFQRRAARGVSLSGNYTVSHCVTDSTYDGRFIQGVIYNKPGDTSYDLGNCPYNQREIANLTVGAQAPRFANPALRALAADWRVSGILSAHTGDWLTVTTARDINFTGLTGQRVDQVNENPYGAKTLTNYLNPAAFAYPALGAYGTEPARGIEGPGFWNIDTALARVLPVGNGRTLELRIEAFNLLNHFNWGDPAVNLDAGTFGRITTQAGNSRVMQFAIKYGF
jgi:hypothetical protein